MAISAWALAKLLGPSESLWLVSTSVVLEKSYMRVTRVMSWEMRSRESSCRVSRDAWASRRLGGRRRISDSWWVEPHIANHDLVESQRLLYTLCHLVICIPSRPQVKLRVEQSTESMQVLSRTWGFLGVTRVSILWSPYVVITQASKWVRC